MIANPTLASPIKDEMRMSARILLVAGPSMTDPRVLQAMATPLVGHLDSEFLKLMRHSQEVLRYAFRTSNHLTIPVPGTGSLGMEAAVANMIEPGASVLVCQNGYFCLRLAEMARRYGWRVTTLDKPWGQIFTPGEIKQALAETSAQVVTVVHAETSTGALQPLEEIARIVHQAGAILIVDAVTSLAGVELQVDAWDLDVTYSGTQKCLSCPPGLAPITLGPRAEEKLRTRKTRVPSWYLDLSLLPKDWGVERTYEHTAPISMNRALDEALSIVREEGIEPRWKRHQQNAELLWEGLQDLGLECFVPESYRIPVLTTVRVPQGIDEARVRLRLLEEYNIEISAGLGELRGKIWRVGLMGHSSRPENVMLLLKALGRILREA